MSTFRKHTNCPSSQVLLLFERGEAGESLGSEVRDHLPDCDFCSAELELYSHVTVGTEEPCAAAEIPRPLYELAEAILGKKYKDFSLLNKLLSETDSVKIEPSVV
jgi:hypothetical protein